MWKTGQDAQVHPAFRSPRNAMTKSHREILESAILLFSRHGFGGTAVHDIAKHTRVTPMTLYRGFKTKDNLIHEVLLLVIQRHFDPAQLLSMLFTDSASNKLPELLLPVLLRWYSSIPVPATKLLINALLSENQKWHALAADAIEKLTDTLRTFIDRELRKRRTSKIIARASAQTLLTVLLYRKPISTQTKSAKKEKQELAEVEATLRYCMIGLEGH